jgi:ubiquitin-activating enzyme E1
MTEIDENLYSRQLYTIGFEAMQKLITTSVLISGINGLGVEIAKNTVLQGFKSVTLHDQTNITKEDISTNYYITEQDIGKNRATTVLNKISELNNYVKVSAITNILTEEILKSYTIIVLVDYNLKDQLLINKISHNHNYFISCSTFGLVGQIFCDFGDNFKITDPDGEPLQTSIIEHIENNSNPLVTCVDYKPHNLYNGDFIKFTNINGMTELNNIDKIEIIYKTKFTFQLKLDTTNFNKYISGGEMIQVKPNIIMNFKDLESSLNDPNFTLIDFIDFDKSNKLHSLIRNLDNINNNYIETLKQYHPNLDLDLINKFTQTYLGKLTPINSIIGGITAQEILKASSGKYTPINQWLYYDALECLPENYQEFNTISETRYNTQVKVFGQDIQDKINKLKYFIVGSGAIGCELLKNFAMMGVGNITITDMDTIEKSNLNRQFLFRNSDINKSKSECAAREILKMNPTINIQHHFNKIDSETENIYNKEFFDNLDGVANALDNVQARLYVDKRCITFKKSLLESGTLGTKANVQVIVPNLTESYGSSRDSPETSIPICTIKTFPYNIDHCIQYSREQFEELFNISINNTKEYLEDKNKINSLTPNDLLPYIKNIKFVLNNIPKDYNDCLLTGYNSWYKYYNLQIKDLLTKFPIDSKTSTGCNFWSGSKKCPEIIDFDINNLNHLNYIKFFANIWANIFNIEIVKNINLNNINLNNININLDEEEDININILNKFNNIDKLILINQEFEKDHDDNYHIDFITSASNMRALNYNINTESRHNIKGIAGKIIPALATTTAVVAGLVSIELYKLVQNFDKLEQYKCAFINLALPYFGFSEPKKVKKSKIGNYEFGLWDSFSLSHLTLFEFLKYFKDNYDLEIDTVIYGNFMVYGVLDDDKKVKRKMKAQIKNIIEKDLGIKLGDCINLQIYTDINDSNNDVELPEVIYYP